MAVIAELPPLYPILDFGLLVEAGLSWEHFAHELRAAGIRFLQYRDKYGSDEEVQERAARLRRVFPRSDSCLILNDRMHLVRTAGFDGVHLGQEDISSAQARVILGNELLIGLSTHNVEQLRREDESSADYIAIGPIFQTSSKHNPDPVVGLETVRAARLLTRKPLVAIGGITAGSCRAVRQAGADSVAVISGLLPLGGETVKTVVEEFLAQCLAVSSDLPVQPAPKGS